MKTNQTNWIKLPQHETNSFTQTLGYFTLLEWSWLGQYIYIHYRIHYRNSVLCAALLSEFYSSATQISLYLLRIWGIYTLPRGCVDGCLVAARLGGFRYLFYNFMIMLIENKGTIIILCWYPAPHFFVYPKRTIFNLRLAWDYKEIGKKEWNKGVIRKRLDDRSYEVELPSGVLRRNKVHLRNTSEPAISREQRPPVPTMEASEQSRENFPEHFPEKSREQSHQQSRQQSHERSHEQPREQSCEQSHEPPYQVEVPLRRSERICKMPAHPNYVLTSGLWTVWHFSLSYTCLYFSH